MPCHNASHTHDWPRSGFLSISKCESKCGFCPSTKDYKPASALRKHALTHIKNNDLPLTLKKSTGGRPRLQTTPVVPRTCNQPESPSAGSQIALATQPVLEIAGADRDPIENNVCISDSSEDVLTPGGYSTYGYRVTSIIENTTSGTDAVHELKSLGSERRLFEAALRRLKISYLYIEPVELETWLQGPRNGFRWLWPHIEQCYQFFLQRFQTMVEPPDTATVLDMFYTTVILLIVKRISYEIASALEERERERTEDGSLTTESAARLLPPRILLILEEENKVLCRLFDEEYHTDPYAILRDGDFDRRGLCQWKFMLIANDLHLSVTDDVLTGVLNTYIDRFGSDTDSFILPLSK